MNLPDARTPPLPCAGPAAADAVILRALCCALLDDVPASARKALLQCLDRTRRSDDLLLLRGSLFETIARFHGDATAHQRLAAWDGRRPG